ncbi:MAG TPA: hypothetical protein VJ866_20755 [Pyrinomonadaceae bacterium]|nr:hypothetical protein [Pyrinomonadaceae bacterium]
MEEKYRGSPTRAASVRRWLLAACLITACAATGAAQLSHELKGGAVTVGGIVRGVAASTDKTEANAAGDETDAAGAVESGEAAAVALPEATDRSALIAASLLPAAPTAAPVPQATPTCNRTITADVVAFDQVYTYNRWGAFNPAGMMYALRRDVVKINSSGDFVAGNVQLRPDKRPRPIVLRANVGDCLQVTFQNLLTPDRNDVDAINFTNQPPTQTYTNTPEKLSHNDEPFTRAASIHANGLEYVNSIADDGASVGNNPDSLAYPNGPAVTYKWYARKQGQYLIYSMGTVAGGEGDGGQLDLGLFGEVNVEPAGAKWYRSQVTAAELQMVKIGENPNGTPKINYEAVYPVGHPFAGSPILNILQGNAIVHTDLNAIITDFTEDCSQAPPSGTCGQNFREFSVVFHDETKTVQAFPELEQPLFHGVRDGFAINYGSGSLGAPVLAARKNLGPVKDCKECKFEEFFLESWPNGDPAMVVRKDSGGGVAEALFPDDPSNVHHSYLNDPVRFRNIHAGPKETHVFHLHAHQWLHEPREDGSTYLDSQTISPGGSFTYEINYGGSGNRNINPGDAIFHCHLYPHFAQGMWELWRNHDVFESGTADRNLPDHEIAGGTPNPAIIPIPNLPMPPMPTADFKGYPFYIAAQAGHRQPQAPYDIDWDGGLPRHRIVAATVVDGPAAIEPALLADPVANRVRTQNTDPNLLAFARKLTSANIQLLPQNGTPEEIKAQQFHQGLFPGGTPANKPLNPPVTPWPGAKYPSYTAAGTPGPFYVNGRAPKPGAPYADPCPDTFRDGNGFDREVQTRNYRAAYIQFDMTVNRAGWHDRQARIAVLEQDVTPTLNGTRAPEPLFFRANSGECIVFKATNLIPNVLNLDDFQIFTPTDTMGQHIHLVKFDVTSSDGAGNGWNYEDGTFTADEVRERIAANNAYQQSIGGSQILTAKVHPNFGPGPDNKWVGAQTTTQRWWADPLVNRAGEDRTIRTVFTHDHFGPSSHQHHGLYAALVVEPTDSLWQAFDGSYLGAFPDYGISGRPDGGPTSFKANIIFDTAETFDQSPSYREFNLAFADFALVYRPDLLPVNPPARSLKPLPIAIEADLDHPEPESISAADPGTELINYRNEPIPLRIRNPSTNAQWADARGDMSNVFSTTVHGQDPFTPLLEGYEGDKVQVRLIQGAQEEQHVFTLHGGRWLHEPSVPNSGYYNGQAIGISEHFEFELPPIPAVGNVRGGNPSTADFLYGSGATDNLWNGMWGIMREYRGVRPGLQPLPANLNGTVSSSDPGLRTDFCPANAPQKQFNVEAWLATALKGANGIPYNDTFGLKDPAGIVFIQQADVPLVQAGTKRLEPLILRANAGDCINVHLKNNLPSVLPNPPGWNFMPVLVNDFNLNQITPSNEVSLHPQLVAYDVRTSDGANIGINDRQTVAPGGIEHYRWYAGRVDVQPNGVRTATPIEYGTINLTDYGDIMKHGSHGAIGTLVIEPQGATWTLPVPDSNATADVVAGTNVFREFVLSYQDDLNIQASDGTPIRNYIDDEDSEDSGMKAFNYRTDPIWARLGFLPQMKETTPPFTDVVTLINNVNQTQVLRSVFSSPQTPIFSASVGSKVRFRVNEPTGHPRQHGFTIFGHSWFHEAWVNNSTVIWRPGIDPEPMSMNIGSQSGHTARRHWNIVLPTGAGGPFRVQGDYLYRTQESFLFTNGLWGIFRVGP